MAETAESFSPPRWRRVWLAALGWTILSLVTALIVSAQEDVPLLAALLSTLVWYSVLGALVWLACRFEVRWRLWTQPLRRALLVRATLAGVALVVWAVVIVAFTRLTVGPDFWLLVFGDWWMFQLLSSLMIYAAGTGIGVAVQNFDRERERERREAGLQVSAREAELAAIKAKLQPHFLFNSLNSIVALIEHDPPEAQRMLIRLASLMHAVLDRLDEPAVPLERELEMIRDYLEIERIRFGDRMAFSIEADERARRISVPPLLLQPIVENAVKHGVEPHARRGVVRITGAVADSRLRLSVTDTGGGRNGPEGSGRSGLGLDLTRRRLQAVYGESGTIRAEREPDGFTVTIDLPVAGDGR